MPNTPKKSGGDIFIVDNADDHWKVQRYLRDWCDISHAFDIATGYFEIGALLALNGQWQQLDSLRILMGDEVSKRTRKAFETGLAQITARLDDSIEAAKEQDDFLSGVPAIIERHTREYTPFEVYARAMAAYFREAELSVSEWEKTESRMCPVLDHYQREGYHNLMQIARRYNGALLCDGVGLGKTFIGLMVIERLLRDRKRVALLVPKAAREDVWEEGPGPCRRQEQAAGVDGAGIDSPHKPEYDNELGG